MGEKFMMMISHNQAVCYTHIKYGFPACSYNNYHIILLCLAECKVFVYDCQCKGGKDRVIAQEQEEPAE